MNKVCVIGSLNIDHVISLKSFPKPGETVRGQDYKILYGGKGGNQAFACRQLGLNTSLLACLGKDEAGKAYLEHLSRCNILTEHIQQVEGPSGMAFITTDHNGENTIVTIGGANHRLNFDALESLLSYDIFLFSLEIPQSLVLKIMAFLHENNKMIVLDPAPVMNFHPQMIDYCTYITPNETEYAAIESYDIPKEKLILKRGANGSELFLEEGSIHVRGICVDTKDTVGAGDTFNAGIAYGILHHYKGEQLLKFANVAAGLSTMKNGAQNGMPTLIEVQKHLKEND